jgi:hypothetical protein
MAKLLHRNSRGSAARSLLMCVTYFGAPFLALNIGLADDADQNLAKDLKKSYFSAKTPGQNVEHKGSRLQSDQSTNSAGGKTGGVSNESNQSGFQYNSSASESRGAKDVSTEIYNKQAAQDAEEREKIAHPFWYSDFWTKSPVALLGLLLGGDRYKYETPPSERERLTQSEYNSGAAVQKFEKTIAFDKPKPKGLVIVGTAEQTKER